MEKKPGLANIKNDRWKYCNLPIRVWTFWFWNLGKKVWLVINDLFDKKCISWRLQSERERKRERRLMDSQPTSVYHSQFDGWVAFVIYIQFACVCLYLCLTAYLSLFVISFSIPCFSMFMSFIIINYFHPISSFFSLFTIFLV